MSSDSAAWLPPRPDPQTGEPRPPHAPVTWDGGGDAETNPRRRPKAPPGQGPLLEWYRDSRSYTYRLTAFTLGLMFVIGTVVSGGFSWMMDWVFWPILFFAPLMMLFGRRHWIAAGAEWFASHTGWVKIYELTKVELAGSGVSPSLYLTDAEGRVAHAELRKMQANTRLWDLVYNGIIHSIHTRDVKVNTSAQIQVVDVGLPRHRRE
ncbi:MAG: hypothetical protein LC799_29080 [Actinobacteria bacterium]|nr:hypothetical protein [Actinomycetota bacterium]